jgi:hypothetical protein
MNATSSERKSGKGSAICLEDFEHEINPRTLRVTNSFVI